MVYTAFFFPILANAAIIGFLILVAILYSFRHKKFTKEVHEALKAQSDRKIEAIYKEYKNEIEAMKTEYCQNVRDYEAKLSEAEKSAEVQKEQNIEAGRQQSITEISSQLATFAVKHYKSKQNRARTLAFIRQFKKSISTKQMRLDEKTK